MPYKVTQRTPVVEIECDSDDCNVSHIKELPYANVEMFLSELGYTQITVHPKTKNGASKDRLSAWLCPKCTQNVIAMTGASK